MNNGISENLAFKLRELPGSPGVYIMRSNGEIIYIGKAINLRNRVRSYFQSRDQGPKVSAMVEKVDDFDIVLCDNNLEAMVLESNLIKRHKPFYNIRLKDDKHYPFLRVSVQEEYPRVEMVRRTKKDGARYFGPYIGAGSVRNAMDAVRAVFPIRTCSYAINPDKPRRPCVLYEIGRCLAPCAGKTTPEEYRAMVDMVISFLSGKTQPVLDELRERMLQASADMHFERAARYRDQIESIQDMMREKQKALSVSGGDRDIVALAQDQLDAMVCTLYIREGKLLGGDKFVLERAGDDDPGEVLRNFILQHYDAGMMLPRELVVTSLDEPADALSEILSRRRGSKVTVSIPQKGDKRGLVEMAEMNAQDALQKRNSRLARDYERTVGAAAALAQAIGLPSPPRRIEGFDISNTQGMLSVASMVVVIDGLPAKTQYRRFRIKTVDGANDFASMAEVVGRRFTHGLRERDERIQQGKPLAEGSFSDMPDLVLIDGGKEQLKFAHGAMIEAGAHVPMFSLAERLEEIFLPGRQDSIILDKHSPALHLIQRLRDEAHRFAITHHRSLRGKQGVQSQLSGIPGIGEARRKALLKHFKTIEKLKAASREDLAAVKGMTRPAADAVYDMFHPPEEK